MASQPEIVFSTSAIDIRWHAEERVMELVWRSFASGPELRTAFEQMLALTEQLGARRWLTDYTELTGMRMADQNWLAKDFIPRVLQRIRLERSAIVQPTDPLSVWFLESMTARLAPIRPWPVRGFINRAAAWVWLVSSEEGPPVETV